jgi:hypothetical protein
VLLGIGAGLLVAGSSLSFVGCSNGPSGSSHPPASQLQEGLNILDAHDAAWGFNAAYVQGGRVVYIESRSGTLKPEVYRNDSPDVPANEMDLRFVDQGNHTFWAQRGGDAWVDTTWTPEIGVTQAYDSSVTLAGRTLDYDIAQVAAKALVAALPASYKDHAYHLNAFAAMVPPTKDPALLAHIQEFNEKAPTPEQARAYGTYSDSTWTQVYAGKWSMPLVCFLWTCAASHSAVAMYSNPDVGAWIYEIAACNHGNCPGGSNMSDDCYSWNGGAWFQYGVQLNGATTSSLTGSGDGLGGCQTAYNWDSGGYNHLCNDDAAYELWQAKVGSQWTGQGSPSVSGDPNSVHGDAIGFQYYGSSYCRGDLCGQSPSYFACDCQTFNGCSGDWNTPVCP